MGAPQGPWNEIVYSLCGQPIPGSCYAGKGWPPAGHRVIKYGGPYQYLTGPLDISRNTTMTTVGEFHDHGDNVEK
jgi:hypothetical protein